MDPHIHQQRQAFSGHFFQAARHTMKQVAIEGHVQIPSWKRHEDLAGAVAPQAGLISLGPIWAHLQSGLVEDHQRSTCICEVRGRPNEGMHHQVALIQQVLVLVKMPVHPSSLLRFSATAALCPELCPGGVTQRLELR